MSPETKCVSCSIKKGCKSAETMSPVYACALYQEIVLIQRTGTQEAMQTISKALKDDPEYAWSWHCNITMAAVDEGMSHYRANHASARFMHNAFGIDITKHDNFKDVTKKTDFMNSSEALFGFMAWLTTRKEVLSIGSSEDCSPFPELIAEFCKVNRLPAVRENYSDLLTHPKV